MALVSIIVPCYNEEKTIQLLLEAIYAQTYPLSELEVIIADGISTDRTRQVIFEFQQTHTDLAIRVIDNKKRTIPSGLNLALESACGEYIVRLDAHSIPARNYVEKCILALGGGKGDNVGGVWNIFPSNESWIARSIAIAVAHPLGAGDAYYRLGGNAKVVDTVPFGAFRRELIKQVGPFDEHLLSNEDYEFNIRIRLSGGTVWFDPEIRSIYFARSNYWLLSSQYRRYGYWKAQVLRRYPNTMRWRQFLPPAFVLSLSVLSILAPWWPLTTLLLGLEIGVYFFLLFVASVSIGRSHDDPQLIIGVPIAIIVMHLSWGSALLWGLIHPVLRESISTG